MYSFLNKRGLETSLSTYFSIYGFYQTDTWKIRKLFKIFYSFRIITKKVFFVQSSQSNKIFT